MPRHPGKIVTPTAFEGRETVAEEQAETRAIKRSGGDVKQAIEVVKGRKASGDRKVSGKR